MSNNLKPWQPGQSGNPSGRPKGARSWGKVVNELLNDEDLLGQLSKHGIVDNSKLHGCKTPLELITVAQIARAIHGDYKAAEWLRRAQYDYEAKNIDDSALPIALVEFIGQASEDELREMAYGPQSIPKA